jgi:hypothetical protein
MHPGFHTLELLDPHASYPHQFSLTLEGSRLTMKLNLFEGPHDNAMLNLFEGPTLGSQRHLPSPPHLTSQSLARVPLCLHLMTPPPGAVPVPLSRREPAFKEKSDKPYELDETSIKSPLGVSKIITSEVHARPG